MVFAFQLILPSVSKLSASSRGFSCDNLQVVFFSLFFSWRCMSLNFKGTITHKINSSRKQKQQTPIGCGRVKSHVKFNHVFLFVTWRWKASESQHSAGDFSVPAPAGRLLQEEQHKVEGIHFLGKDAKLGVSGAGQSPSSSQFYPSPLILTASFSIVLVL